MLERESSYIISKEVLVTNTTGAYSVNVLQVTGTVMIVNQYAEITYVGDMSTITNVYATLYDGTNTVNLTADGLDLSGATVGTFFTKDKVATEIYSVNKSDQCRMLETLGDKKAGRPFLVTQKNGTNTYIRFHYTVGITPVDFKMTVYMEYRPMNGGTLTFL